jgi:hypothetical protein
LQCAYACGNEQQHVQAVAVPALRIPPNLTVPPQNYGFGDGERKFFHALLKSWNLRRTWAPHFRFAIYDQVAGNR